MRINVRLTQELSARKIVQFDVKGSDLIVSIKEKIKAKEGISKCLMFGGIHLEDNLPLSFYGIINNSNLELGKKKLLYM